MNKKLLIIGMYVILSVFAHAQDRLFVNTYQSLTLLKGETDIEIWNSQQNWQKPFLSSIKQQLFVDYRLAD